MRERGRRGERECVFEREREWKRKSEKERERNWVRSKHLVGSIESFLEWHLVRSWIFDELEVMGQQTTTNLSSKRKERTKQKLPRIWFENFWGLILIFWNLNNNHYLIDNENYNEPSNNLLLVWKTQLKSF